MRFIAGENGGNWPNTLEKWIETNARYAEQTEGIEKEESCIMSNICEIGLIWH